MAATQRSIRSHAAPARPDEGTRRIETRPQLILRRHDAGDAMARGVHRIATWTRSRRAPLIHVVIAVIFLVASLVGSLLFRTKMVENSFEQTQVESSISTLTQDIQADQAKLDDLETSLPDKAEKMGMIPAQKSISIDLKGYKAEDADGSK
ncbi:hypothetical protein [uncultured Bifidobacterium sp.]|uniref:hypothetical protein n=1 Tax=uncultured Bifidobacterium sp. TaxID=165187 RepID=UPI002608FF94|nr:hypothetical protein [uncultured Bifidobacterium sp.]